MQRPHGFLLTVLFQPRDPPGTQCANHSGKTNNKRSCQATTMKTLCSSSSQSRSDATLDLLYGNHGYQQARFGYIV